MLGNAFSRPLFSNYKMKNVNKMIKAFRLLIKSRSKKQSMMYSFEVGLQLGLFCNPRINSICDNIGLVYKRQTANKIVMCSEPTYSVEKSSEGTCESCTSVCGTLCLDERKYELDLRRDD